MFTYVALAHFPLRPFFSGDPVKGRYAGENGLFGFLQTPLNIMIIQHRTTNEHTHTSIPIASPGYNDASASVMSVVSVRTHSHTHMRD